MIQYEKTDLMPSAEIAKDVEKRIRTTGVKDLNFDMAREAGVFQRISLLLCAMHSSIVAAYRIFGAVDSLTQDVRCKRMDIAKTMNRFESEYDRFRKFWTDFYSQGSSEVDVNKDTEVLYRNIMRWTQLPEHWNIGDAQRLNDSSDAVISVDCGDEDDNIVNFFKKEMNEEVEALEESWCVSKYDTMLCRQVIVEKDMDKASAKMVAKRLSNEDPENLYIASQVQDVTKKETIITPFIVFRNNESVGETRNYLK